MKKVSCTSAKNIKNPIIINQGELYIDKDKKIYIGDNDSCLICVYSEDITDIGRIVDQPTPLNMKNYYGIVTLEN